MAESPGMAAANGDARRGDTLCVLLRRWARTCRLCLQGCLHDRDVPSWCPGHAEMVSLFVGEESATSEVHSQPKHCPQPGIVLEYAC